MRNFIVCCVLPYVLQRVRFFLFGILCSGIVGSSEVWSAEILRSLLSYFHFGKCYVITVLRGVT